VSEFSAKVDPEESTRQAKSWQERLYASVLSAVAIGQSVKVPNPRDCVASKLTSSLVVAQEDFIVLNAVSILWNLHVHIFQAQASSAAVLVARELGSHRRVCSIQNRLLLTLSRR
jgi:hypothetical protein